MLSPLEAFHVRHQVREIEQKYDYRYSQLILVSADWFARVALRRSNFVVCLKKSCRTFGASSRCELADHGIHPPARDGLHLAGRVDVRAAAVPSPLFVRAPVRVSNPEHQR